MQTLMTGTDVYHVRPPRDSAPGAALAVFAARVISDGPEVVAVLDGEGVLFLGHGEAYLSRAEAEAHLQAQIEAVPRHLFDLSRAPRVIREKFKAAFGSSGSSSTYRLTTAQAAVAARDILNGLLVPGTTIPPTSGPLQMPTRHATSSGWTISAATVVMTSAGGGYASYDLEPDVAAAVHPLRVETLSPLLAALADRLGNPNETNSADWTWRATASEIARAVADLVTPHLAPGQQFAFPGLAGQALPRRFKASFVLTRQALGLTYTDADGNETRMVWKLARQPVLAGRA